MHSEEWTDRLSDYLDGELTDSEQREVASHVAECEECARLVEELQAVVTAARQLTDAGPQRDLWTGIAGRIAVQPIAQPSAGGWRYSFSLPQLAAASVLIAVLSGWAALRVLPNRSGAEDPAAAAATTESLPPADAVPASFDDAEYDTAVADLESALQQGRATLDPATITVLEENLAIIDAAVREARQALVEDPGNGFLSGYLVETRRRKLDFLRRAASLSTEMN
jgi:Putative zinc-finger